VVGNDHAAVRWRNAVVVETLIARAPGRVNLIGEHTDYNDGFVLPIAINRYTTVRLQPRDDEWVRVYSCGFGSLVEIPLQPDADSVPQDWARYVHGVIRVLQSEGLTLRGADLQIESTVPVGAGLSSSAALEVACAVALLHGAGISLDLTVLAKLCQRAENDYAGAHCGIMDQYAACHAQQGQALLLDCRSLTHRYLPVDFADTPAVFVVCNSGVRHELASGEYNLRRSQCQIGLQALQRRNPEILSLRDATDIPIEALAPSMDTTIQRRVRHVISENERVLAAAAALERGDAKAFGGLMSDSHRSLRDDYEVSCHELDLLVEIALGIEGVLGARMTGGGFGGSTVNLVDASAVESFMTQLDRSYATATGRQAQLFVCSSAAGVSVSVDPHHAQV
jgi:galactokinase